MENEIKEGRHLNALTAELRSVMMIRCVCVSAALGRTSDLLGLNPEQLAEVLTHRSMILRGEEICTPLTVEQVSTF